MPNYRNVWEIMRDTWNVQAKMEDINTFQLFKLQTWEQQKILPPKYGFKVYSERPLWR